MDYFKLRENTISTRLRQLASAGLVDKKDYNLLLQAMKKINSDKKLNPNERELIIKVVNTLVGVVTGDSTIFQKTKKAVSEDVMLSDLLNEAMTAAEKKKREEIVIGMKKSKGDLKKRYGDRWKDVMYATATKMAMKEEVEQIDEISKDKAYSYFKKSYDDEADRRGEIINRKTPATPDEKRKIANRAKGRKLATARVLGKDGMEKAKAARARGKAGKKDKAVGSAVFHAFKQDRKKETTNEEKHPAIKRAGVEGFSKPKRTPSHPTKSHIVVVKDGSKVKTIRFGEQGAETAGDPKKGESERMKMKRKSFKARHRRNIAKGKTSAAYWADKVKW